MINEEKVERKFFVFVWVLLITSGFVIIEPTPFDLLFCCLLVVSFLTLTYKLPLYPLIFSLIFLIGNVISLFNVIDIKRAIKYFAISLYLILLFFFFVVLVNNFRERIIKIIFSGYCISAVLSAVLGVIGFLRIFPGEIFLKYDRAVALFKDPNVFGPFLVPIALYSIHKIENVKNIYKKLFWIIIFHVIVGGILLSFSRAAWLNLFISLFIYFMVRLFILTKKDIYIRKKILTVIFMLTVLTSIMLSCLFYIQSFENIFNSRLGFQSYDKDRFSTQMLALNIFLKNVFGISPGHSEIVLQHATHNTFLRVLVENGIIGFIGYILLLLFTIKKGVNLLFTEHHFSQIYLIIISSLVGIIINSFFIDTLHWRHFWVLLAIPWIQKSVRNNVEIYY